MSLTLQENRALQNEQEELTATTTTSHDKLVQGFTRYPIARVRTLPSTTQKFTELIDSDTQAFYLATRRINATNAYLPSCPYELIIIENETEELRSDNIAIHNMAYRRNRNIEFVQLSTDIIGENPLQYIEPLPDDEEPDLRGIFPLQCTRKVIYTQEVDINLEELPRWEPHIVIDLYRLEDDDE